MVDFWLVICRRQNHSKSKKKIDKSGGITDKNFEELLKLINKVDQICTWGNSIEEPRIFKELILKPKCFGKNVGLMVRSIHYFSSSVVLQKYR